MAKNSGGHTIRVKTYQRTSDSPRWRKRVTNESVHEAMQRDAAEAEVRRLVTRTVRVTKHNDKAVGIHSTVGLAPIVQTMSRKAYLAQLNDARVKSGRRSLADILNESDEEREARRALLIERAGGWKR